MQIVLRHGLPRARLCTRLPKGLFSHNTVPFHQKHGPRCLAECHVAICSGSISCRTIHSLLGCYCWGYLSRLRQKIHRDAKVLMDADGTDEKGGALVGNQSEGVASPLQRLFRHIVIIFSIVCIKIDHDVLSLLGKFQEIFIKGLVEGHLLYYLVYI